MVHECSSAPKWARHTVDGQNPAPLRNRRKTFVCWCFQGLGILILPIFLGGGATLADVATAPRAKSLRPMGGEQLQLLLQGLGPIHRGALLLGRRRRRNAAAPAEAWKFRRRVEGQIPKGSEIPAGGGASILEKGGMQKHKTGRHESNERLEILPATYPADGGGVSHLGRAGI